MGISMLVCWEWIKGTASVILGVFKMKHKKVKRTINPNPLANGVNNRKPMPGYMSNTPTPVSTITITDDIKRQFAMAYVDWLRTIPDSKFPWVDALMAAAIDETHGNLMEALRIVQEEYAKGE
jgi:hypothetical protein